MPNEARARFFDLKSPRDFALLLDVPYSLLVWHVSRADRPEQYKSFDIPKRYGGFRRINAPATPLKIIQWKLNFVLSCVYEPRSCVHGFAAGRSIKSNAEIHKNQKYVLNVDLLDFFPSINFGRVRGLFIAPPYNFDPKVATVLARICTHNNELPQGAPTSPIISNLISSKMDRELQRLSNSRKARYSRYADDLSFSTSEKTFPAALATIDAGTGKVSVGQRLKEVVESNGFNINEQKIRLQLRNSRQVVTGLIVNVRPNVKRKFVRQIRAMLHAWKKHGLDAAEAEFLAKFNVKHRNPIKQPPKFREVLKGKLSFLRMVRGKDDNVYKFYRNRFKELKKRST